jgi:hypothetical protein
VNDLVDAPGRYTDVFRRTGPADPHGKEELLEKDFPGVDRPRYLRHDFTSGGIDDFYTIRIAVFPSKADSPPFGHADAVLASSIAGAEKR